MDYHTLDYKFNMLSDDLKREALTFIDFLMAKKKSEKTHQPHQFDFTWEGGLSDLKNQYNSVDLQHQSMEWR